MSTVIKKRSTVELIKILLDGEWHDTHYLALAAGKYIPPEKASRVTSGGTVASGQSELIRSRLKNFVKGGRIEKRSSKDKVNSRYCSEWRLVDFEWARREIARFDGNRGLKTLAALPTLERSVTLTVSEYNLLSGIKQAYESTSEKDITWGAFLIHLLARSLGARTT